VRLRSKGGAKARAVIGDGFGEAFAVGRGPDGAVTGALGVLAFRGAVTGALGVLAFRGAVTGAFGVLAFRGAVPGALGVVAFRGGQMRLRGESE
jgi:hypothetical protein